MSQILKPLGVLLLLGCVTAAVADEGSVKLATDFPGGNLKVHSNEGGVVQAAPDLGGGRDWFYWCFEATAVQPGDVRFQFPEKVAGFRRGAVGFQGPAVSADGGKTWRWRGENETATSADHFVWRFERVGQKVRFASTIPYTRADLDAFVQQHKANPHLKSSVLTKTRRGREVPLLQIGQPGAQRKAVLMTCRHHACESIASFLLEGVLQAAMSDSDTGCDFRKNYVLYVVPLVDADGVEAGDQGKNRPPHDHNRDYAGDSIYRSVQAIKLLGREKKIRVLLDLHCPTLVMDIHQRFYFAGPSDAPAENSKTVGQFADLLREEFPEGAPAGPVLQLKPTGADRQKHCSGYFSKLPGVLMAATLETPFAPRKKQMSQQHVRSYGAALLRAWNRLELPGE